VSGFTLWRSEPPMMKKILDFCRIPGHGQPAVFSSCARPGPLLLTLLILTSCASNSNSHNSAAAPSPPIILKSEDIDTHVRAFNDTFMTRVTQQYTEIIFRAKTPEVRSWAIRSRLSQGMAALSDATGPNPTENLLNFVVQVTLKRMSLEENWIPNLLHDDGKDLLTEYQKSEKDVWDLAARVFTSEQIAELHELIDRWRRDNPESYYAGFVKFTDFVGSAPPSSPNSQKVLNSLIGLVYVDPFEGLDPVAQEAHGFRMLSERIVFIALRAPALVSWQIDDATDRILNSPQIQRVISTSEQYASIGNRLDDLTTKLPGDFSQRANDAIDRINAAATTQRDALVNQLNSQSNQIHGILADARSSLAAARDSAGSINENTAQTITLARSTANEILNRAVSLVILVIVVACVCPAVVLLGYHYCKSRWIRRSD
jgi:hypothetical protein